MKLCVCMCVVYMCVRVCMCVCVYVCVYEAVSVCVNINSDTLTEVVLPKERKVLAARTHEWLNPPLVKKQYVLSIKRMTLND